MSQTIPKTLTAGVQTTIPLPSTSNIQTVDLGNGTPFDLTIGGFGVEGDMIVEAGTKVRLYANILNEGKIRVLPVNNVNAPATTGVINLTVYFVSEKVPPGTFPVQIPVQVVQATVSTVSQLSNEGNAVGTEVIDIGTTANPKLVDIFNDHFTWSVEQSGTKHTVLQGKTSGNPLLIGQSGDTTEVLGSLLVDQTETVTGTLIASGGLNTNTIRDNVNGNTAIDLSLGTGAVLLTKGTLGVAAAGDVIDAGTANALYIKARTAGTIHFQSPNGTDIGQISSAGMRIPNNTAYQSTDADGVTVRNLLIEDATNIVTINSGSLIKLNPPSGQATWFQVQNSLYCLADIRGFVAASGASQGYTFENGNFLPDISFFSGTGSGTYNHTYGSAPFWVSPMCTTTNSSQTQGYDTVTATQVHITCGAGLSFKAFCG